MAGISYPGDKATLTVRTNKRSKTYINDILEEGAIICQFLIIPCTAQRDSKTGAGSGMMEQQLTATSRDKMDVRKPYTILQLIITVYILIKQTVK
jgi:hypothetical protein